MFGNEEVCRYVGERDNEISIRGGPVVLLRGGPKVKDGGGRRRRCDKAGVDGK